MIQMNLLGGRRLIHSVVYIKKASEAIPDLEDVINNANENQKPRNEAAASLKNIKRY